MVNESAVTNESTSGWFGWYVVCMCLPFTAREVFGLIRPYELAALLALFSMFFVSKSGYRRITILDALVVIYALYQIVVVIVGSSVFYESARAYRYVVLGPVLVYAAVRLLPFSYNVVRRAHMLLIIVVLLQTLYTIKLYTETGQRIAGLIHEYVGYGVVYAVTAAYVFVYLIFSWSELKSRRGKILTLVGILVMAMGLYASASRGVVIPLVLALLAGKWIWRSANRRRLLAVYIKSGLVILTLLIAFSPPRFDYDPSQLLENKKSISRLVSVQDYLADGTARIQFWASLFDTAMNNPVFGHGASAYALGANSTVEIVLSGRHIPNHSHNMLMGSVLAGGLPVLVLTLLLVFSMFDLVRRFPGRPGSGATFEKTLVVWSMVFLVVGLTNLGAPGVAFFFILAFMQQLVLHAEATREAPIPVAAVTPDATRQRKIQNQPVPESGRLPLLGRAKRSVDKMKRLEG